MNKTKLITFISLRFLAIFLFIISFFDKYVGDLLYFTVQSNLLVVIVFLLLNIFDILKLKEKFLPTPNFIYILKYIATVGIFLTFLIFGLVLTPLILFKTEYPFYVLSISSLSMHLIIPSIALVDWIINDYLKEIKLSSFLLPISFPLAYFIFTMIASVLGVEYPGFFGVDGTSHVPYFFLDYSKYGWFKISVNNNTLELGVFYWVIAITLLVALISFLLLLIKFLKFKKINKIS